MTSRNWKQRQPYFGSPGETLLGVSNKVNAEVVLDGGEKVALESLESSEKLDTTSKARLIYDADMSHSSKENEVLETKKAKSVSKEGLDAVRLFDKSTDSEDELCPPEDQRDSTPVRARTPPRTSSCLPETPPRQKMGRSVTPMPEVEVPLCTPPRAKTRAEPCTPPPRSGPLPCTPPRNPPTRTPASTSSIGRAVKRTPMRTPPHTPPRPIVHNPYRFQTPPPVPSPLLRRNAALCKASPLRTPTRTRLAVQKQNNPKTPILSPQLSLSLAGLPGGAASAGTPGQEGSGAAAAELDVTSPTQFLFNGSSEHLPPSLQQPHVQQQQQGYQQQQAMETPQGYMQYGYAATSIVQQQPPPQQQPQQQQQFNVVDHQQTQPQYVQQAVPMTPSYGQTNFVQNMLGTPSPASSVNTSVGSICGTPGPQTPGGSVPQRIYTLVEFKRGRTVQFQSSYFCQPGEYVVVEGDNGEDMGMVCHTWVAPASSPPVVNNSLNSNKNSNGSDVDPVTGDPVYSKVLRQATPKEVQYLHNAQAAAEMKCTEVAKHKVLEHGLQMAVVDSEYQFDRKKLTFYYDADERIDFRELVRDLYKLYRARIWMSKVRDGEERRHVNVN